MFVLFVGVESWYLQLLFVNLSLSILGNPGLQRGGRREGNGSEKNEERRGEGEGKEKGEVPVSLPVEALGFRGWPCRDQKGILNQAL